MRALSSTGSRARGRHQGPTRARAFTLTELVVVLALMGLLSAFAVPQLLSGNSLGQDQHAKTTASGAADAAARTYASAVAAQYWDSGMLADTIAATSADLGRSLTPGEVAALPRMPRRPDVAPTSLRAANPDVLFVAGSDPSTGVDTASLGARLVGSDAAAAAAYWVIGVAVNVHKPTDPGAGTCWMVQLAPDAPAPGHVETYLMLPFADNDPGSAAPAEGVADQCTGQVAANLDAAALASAPGAGTTAAGRVRGTAWGRPLIVTAQAAAAAAAAAVPVS